MINNKPKVLGCDLDGTLLEYATYPNFGKPIEGMPEVLRALRDLGWKVAIWTSA
jgi:hydroxymethylpyrimidine pyrophosphatase-like HAD family hydrolase